MFDNSGKCVFLQPIKCLILKNMKKERYLEDNFNGFVEELINLSRLEVKEEGIAKRMLAKVLKTEDIHPPKTGISVHFSGSLV